jgi:hypothetical protein
MNANNGIKTSFHKMETGRIDKLVWRSIKWNGATKNGITGGIKTGKRIGEDMSGNMIDTKSPNKIPMI